ncbi:MAG: WXG100 family type VII secretion target [Clostridiales bacterium]|nr:WXG100 family type VII secretion target [Clostridiales bacterium]
MIKIDYDDQLRRGAAINSLAGDLEQLAADVDNLSLELTPHWRGQAAQAYARQCEILRESIRKTSKDMENVGLLVETTAVGLKQAEQEANALTGGLLS